MGADIVTKLDWGASMAAGSAKRGGCRCDWWADV